MFCFKEQNDLEVGNEDVLKATESSVCFPDFPAKVKAGRLAVTSPQGHTYTSLSPQRDPPRTPSAPFSSPRARCRLPFGQPLGSHPPASAPISVPVSPAQAKPAEVG